MPTEREESQESETQDTEVKAESNTEKNSNTEDVGTPFVISTPKQDGVINANLITWDVDSDRDIIGNTYSSAMKLSVYNMIYALGGGFDNIHADVHIPFGEKFTGTMEISLVP